MDLETHLSDININTEEDIRLIVDNINIERLKNNPRSVLKRDVKSIITQIHLNPCIL